MYVLLTAIPSASTTEKCVVSSDSGCGGVSGMSPAMDSLAVARSGSIDAESCRARSGVNVRAGRLTYAGSPRNAARSRNVRRMTSVRTWACPAVQNASLAGGRPAASSI